MVLSIHTRKARAKTCKQFNQAVQSRGDGEAAANLPERSCWLSVVTKDISQLDAPTVDSRGEADHLKSLPF
jgi:hypothetical protein